MSLVNANIAIPINAAVAANVLSDGAIAYADAAQNDPDRPVEPRRGRMVMADQDYQALTREQLNELAGEELPERAAMSLINANVAAPVNLAAALNVASDGSVAIANARADRGHHAVELAEASKQSSFGEGGVAPPSS